MHVADDRKLAARFASPEISTAKSLGTWTKVAICVALVLVFVAIEIDLLHSGALVVLMPE
jgi:hypothetical protein